MRAYVRRKQFEGQILARAVVEALSEAMQPAEGGGDAAPPTPATSDKVPAGRLMAMMGVTF